MAVGEECARAGAAGGQREDPAPPPPIRSSRALRRGHRQPPGAGGPGPPGSPARRPGAPGLHAGATPERGPGGEAPGRGGPGREEASPSAPARREEAPRSRPSPLGASAPEHPPAARPAGRRALQPRWQPPPAGLRSLPLPSAAGLPGVTAEMPLPPAPRPLRGEGRPHSPGGRAGCSAPSLPKGDTARHPLFPETAPYIPARSGGGEMGVGRWGVSSFSGFSPSWLLPTGQGFFGVASAAGRDRANLRVLPGPGTVPTAG